MGLRSFAFGAVGLSSLFLAASTQIASAGIVTVKFASDATGVTDPIHTPVGTVSVYNSIPVTSSTNLVDSTNTNSGVDVSISGVTPGNAAATVNSGDALSSSLATSAPSWAGDREFMDRHIYTTNGNTLRVTVSDLATFAPLGYDLYVYYHSGHGAFHQTFSVDTDGVAPVQSQTARDTGPGGGNQFNGTYSQTTGPSVATVPPVGNYVKFSGLDGASFVLSATGLGTGPDSGQYGYLNGIQIVSIVPEPATLGLACVGLIALRRRRA